MNAAIDIKTSVKWTSENQRGYFTALEDEDDFSQGIQINIYWIQHVSR